MVANLKLQVQTWWMRGASVLWVWRGGNSLGCVFSPPFPSPQMRFPDLCYHLTGPLQRLWTNVNKYWSDCTLWKTWALLKRRNPLPEACQRLPYAAGPCLQTRSAGRWGGQIYTAGRRARSGGCPSHGWPGSASLPLARCRRERKRKQTEQMVENKAARWPGDGVVSPDGGGSTLNRQVAMPVRGLSCLSRS